MAQPLWGSLAVPYMIDLLGIYYGPAQRQVTWLANFHKDFGFILISMESHQIVVTGHMS